MINKITLRRAKTSDINTLAELRWKLCTDDSPNNTIKKRKFIEEFCTTLPNIENNDNCLHFVAEYNGKIISVLSIIKVTKIPSPNDTYHQYGYLTNVYTLPKFRNKGVGGALLEKIKNDLEIQKLELLIVWPSAVIVNVVVAQDVKILGRFFGVWFHLFFPGFLWI
ncbi:GNAT family N-acetyltransferase [Candidatus Regiella insecticola]|uniref:GNAT family N-acetyltransferase n=1 Tax=Candidatus Regiella insecticola TaxID=138073 RepID=UPI0006824145|nr:GNAT family N-acetyltransferase [Candidatus Regiella insecticola]